MLGVHHCMISLNRSRLFHHNVIVLVISQVTDTHASQVITHVLKQSLSLLTDQRIPWTLLLLV